MNPGTRVRLNAAFKARLLASDFRDDFLGFSGRAHVGEFGDCVGVVLGPVVYDRGRTFEEVDVRWEPSGLRYGYKPENLEPLREGAS